MKSRIIVHGGAGSHEIDQPEDVIEEAAEQGKAAMGQGTATDAVEVAVNRLEDHQAFNAGNGAKYQLDGNPRPEAALMTSKGDAGAISGLKDICHAVSVARDVMENTHHIMLSKPQATEFAREMGHEQSDIRTEKAQQEWEAVYERVKDMSWDEQIEALQEYDTTGTVGAVAIDQEAGLAAATSTGGRSPQLAGRVGDTPLIGCGTYANTHAAVSATGVGEAIMIMTLARRCTEYIEHGNEPSVAAEKTIEALEDKTGRHAGIIMLDKEGRVGTAHNTEEMNTVVK